MRSHEFYGMDPLKIFERVGETLEAMEDGERRVDEKAWLRVTFDSLKNYRPTTNYHEYFSGATIQYRFQTKHTLRLINFLRGICQIS